ncbi:MAG: transcription-repair coupling factor [Mariprofundaceae bacterium]
MIDAASLHDTARNMPSEPPGLAFRLAELARRPGLHVWICPDLASYRQLAEELAFFLADASGRLRLFPAWELLPYDRVSPHHTIVGQRFATLSALLSEPDPQGILLTALPAWLQRIAPPESIAAHVWRLEAGQRLDIAELGRRLCEAGMMPVERVLAPGEYAIRGGLLDLWPAAESRPLRIDMFGDEIEAIRRFDPESQRSEEAIARFVSTPAREVILDEAGIERFTAAFRARFPHLRRHPVLEAVRAGRPHPGIETLLPLAYPRTARLTDYLPDGAIIHAPEDIEARREAFARQVRAQFEMVRASQEPSIAPQELFAIETPIQAAPPPREPRTEAAPAISDFPDAARPLHRLLDTLRNRLEAGWRIRLVGHGHGQRDRLIEAAAPLADAIPARDAADAMVDAQAPVLASVGWLAQGFALPDARLLFLTGRELLGQRLPRKRAGRRLRADIFADLSELREGAPVVHEDHGVGRYRGIETMGEGEERADFIKIEYAEGAHVWVPVEDLGRLHRYVGDDQPALAKLGTERWRKARERTRRDLLAMAHELIETEARRSRAKRPPIRLEGALLERYEEFVARFPFEETDDQAEAIDQVLADLARDAPMDRVICGDVGFGKTEVAMRAAFVVAASGRQVALLAPTTVLANQHHAKMLERFAGTGLDIALVSRLQGKAEIERIARGLAGGRIRIVVGTHRLLSDAFRFADLGLVIVDEEQRFGVRHKQKLKELHAAVDMLTLTATPIPRTLHQTLSGLRAVSIIQTPPAEREAIRTMVTAFDPHLANEAIRRELYRGGQVYYLHNHVKSIERIAARLREEIPEASIGIAHGQMPAGELDRQMMDFYDGRLNVLVCTTIVESGLDVPNANTLIVERADLLGLAQLHQIRGRVGRSHRQAFAYLFTPDPRAMTREARERLQAIAEHSELGAGFLLARQDMEIRGAGNLLGAEQSGRIEEVGLDLYMEMLAEAVAEARGETPAPRQPLDLHLGMPAILPPDYIPQAGERLAMYRRIARAESDAEIALLFEEMTDRFGRMPEEARLALAAAGLRWRGRKLAISAIRRTTDGLKFHFTEASPVDPARMLARVQREPARFRLTPDGQLTLRIPEDAPHRAWLDQGAAFLDELLAEAGASPQERHR